MDLTLALSAGISVSGLLDKTENVPDDKKPPKRARRQSQKKPSSKAFDAVLEKEDREGPIVVTSAGEDGMLSVAIVNLSRLELLVKSALV